MDETCHHPTTFAVDRVLLVGRYLDVPVLVVADDGDGWVTALWPDRLDPGRSYGKERPFTFDKREWWMLWKEQVHPHAFAFEPLEFPLQLDPKPEPNA